MAKRWGASRWETGPRNSMIEASGREQEKYECFGIPDYVWTDRDGVFAREPSGWFRRNWVYREAAKAAADTSSLPPMDVFGSREPGLAGCAPPPADYARAASQSSASADRVFTPSLRHSSSR